MTSPVRWGKYLPFGSTLKYFRTLPQSESVQSLLNILQVALEVVALPLAVRVKELLPSHAVNPRLMRLRYDPNGTIQTVRSKTARPRITRERVPSAIFFAIPT
jgi:hypothetical protein